MATIVGMEGSVSNVQFTERKRGFDPDEVANYLAHIDDKIAGLRGIAAEAIERAEQAEERARVAETRATTSEEGPAQAANILALAQQTADATVTQARDEAESLLVRAREDADRIRLAAEAESQQLLADARRDLESRRTEHLETLRREIDELVSTRDAVASEVTLLEGHLARQRDRVVQARDALTLVAEDPEALRSVELPEAVGVGGGWGEDSSGGARVGADESYLVSESVVEEVVLDDEAGDGYVARMVVEDVVASDATSGEVLAEAVVEDLTLADAETGDVFAESVVIEAAGAGPADLPWGDADPQATAPVAAVGGLFDDEAPPADFAAEAAGGLFGDEPGPETAFGAFDEEDDEAMRAFFEGEVGGEDRSGRWGFRRR